MDMSRVHTGSLWRNRDFPQEIRDRTRGGTRVNGEQRYGEPEMKGWEGRNVAATLFVLVTQSSSRWVWKIAWRAVECLRRSSQQFTFATRDGTNRQEIGSRQDLRSGVFCWTLFLICCCCFFLFVFYFICFHGDGRESSLRCGRTCHEIPGILSVCDAGWRERRTERKRLIASSRM